MKAKCEGLSDFARNVFRLCGKGVKTIPSNVRITTIDNDGHNAIWYACQYLRSKILENLLNYAKSINQLLTVFKNQGNLYQVVETGSNILVDQPLCNFYAMRNI